MPAVETEESSPAPQAAAPPAPPPTASGALRLLVADDILVNRTLARIMLERAGHAVELVANGMEAVEAVQRAHFDAVLMDVQMPLMDGLEATRRIRALNGPAARVPIVALSASAMVDQVAACMAAGMDGHLAKPINRGELLAMLEKVARQRAAAPMIHDLMAEIRAGLKLLPSRAAEGDLPGVAAAARRLLPALRELDAADAVEATVRLEQVAEAGGEVASEIIAWERATAGLGQDRGHPPISSAETHRLSGVA